MNVGAETSVVLEYVNCPRCGMQESEPLYAARDYLYHIPGEFYVANCRRCGLLFQNPRPAVLSLPLIYPKSYVPHDAPAASDVEPSWVRRLLQAINLIRWQHARTSLRPRLVSEGKLLELGCASGARLIWLRRQGWKHLHGIELSPSAAKTACSMELEVRCGRLEEVIEEFPDGYFDVVISSMVLEHLLDPFKVVRQVARKLKPGGQFLFSTITRDSLDAKLYGKYWAGFDLPRHMVFFTKNDIALMLGGEFDEIKFRHQVAPVDYVRSSSWRIREGQAGLFDRLAVVLGESLFSQILALGLAWLGKSCRVSVCCRKN